MKTKDRQLRSAPKEAGNMRLAERRDIPAIIELLKTCDLYYPEDDTPENLERKLEHDGDLMWVTTWHERVVGFVMATYDGWAAIVWHLGVHPKFRQRGIGKLLLYYVGGCLKRRGATVIYGFVKKTNRRMLRIVKEAGGEFGPEVVSVGLALDKLLSPMQPQKHREEK